MCACMYIYIYIYMYIYMYVYKYSMEPSCQPNNEITSALTVTNLGFLIDYLIVELKPNFSTSTLTLLMSEIMYACI